MESQILKIKKLKQDIDNIKIANEGDAGIDLRASGHFTTNLDFTIEKKEIENEFYYLEPGERVLVKTGIIAEIPKGHWGNIRGRSGLALNFGIQILGGVIDEAYRGEIGVILVNTGKKPYQIKKNERIAQMIIQPYTKVEIQHHEELDNKTERASTGFGNSGKF